MVKLRRVIDFLKPNTNDVVILASYEIGYNGFGFDFEPLGAVVSIPIVYLAGKIIKKEYDYLKTLYNLRKEKKSYKETLLY